MNKEINEIIEQIKTAINFKKQPIPMDYNISIYDMEQLLDYITNLQEIRKEHSIMKQFIYENGLWERFLNDNRFLEHLRSEDNG